MVFVVSTRPSAEIPISAFWGSLLMHELPCIDYDNSLALLIITLALKT